MKKIGKKVAMSTTVRSYVAICTCASVSLCTCLDLTNGGAVNENLKVAQYVAKVNLQS